VKEDTEYSTPWKNVNIIANTIVTTVPYNAPFLLPCINEWWAYVIVTPDDNNIIVFNNGNSKGFTACIPNGGHCAPNSTLGDIALWKNAQKIAKKKNTSEIINNPTPKFNPFCTAFV
jgi:hypothetical protein